VLTLRSVCDVLLCSGSFGLQYEPHSTILHAGGGAPASAIPAVYFAAQSQPAGAVLVPNLWPVPASTKSDEGAEIPQDPADEASEFAAFADPFYLPSDVAILLWERQAARDHPDSSSDQPTTPSLPSQPQQPPLVVRETVRLGPWGLSLHSSEMLQGVLIALAVLLGLTGAVLVWYAIKQRRQLRELRDRLHVRQAAASAAAAAGNAAAASSSSSLAQTAPPPVNRPRPRLVRRESTAGDSAASVTPQPLLSSASPEAPQPTRTAAASSKSRSPASQKRRDKLAAAADLLKSEEGHRQSLEGVPNPAV
jgi:hypothetical protein